MSNIGQAALTVVGFAVGTALGAPQLGFFIGSLAGSALFPTKLPGQTGPRLQDTRTTNSQVGGPVIEVLGTEAVAGTVIWMAPLREQSSTEEVGGKGAPSQKVTTYSYFQSIAIGLCRGEMGGLSRIWENGSLVYDARGQLADESDDEFTARLAKAAEYAEGFTVYLGSSTQTADPTIQADKGIADTPAFRGLMYIVYHERQLREDQALRHPNFKFEVFTTGDQSTYFSNEVLHPWLAQSTDPTNPLNTNSFSVRYTGATTLDVNRNPEPAFTVPGTFDTLAEAVAAVTSVMGFSPSIAVGYSGAHTGGSEGWVTNAQDLAGPGTTNNDYNPSSLHLIRSYVAADKVLSQAGQAASGLAITTYMQNNGVALNNIYIDGAFTDGYFGDGGVWSGPVLEAGGPNFSLPYQFGVATGAATVLPVAVCASFTVARLPGPPVAGAELLAGSYKVLQTFAEATPPRLPLNPCIESGSASDTQAFWEAAYAEAVTEGTMSAGKTYVAAGNGDQATTYPVAQAWAYQVTVTSVDPGRTTLAACIRRITDRCGITEAQLDVSDLETIEIVGYAMARIMTGRDAIDPLRTVGFFDVVESEGKLKFPVRGGAAVRTIASADLGATDSQAGPAISTTDTDPTEMPRIVRVHYRAHSRDYEDGEQISPSRTTADTAHVSDLELAVALLDTHAAEIAEAVWADAWSTRRRHGFSLSAQHLDLEPADVILVPINGFLERVRIMNIDDSLPLLRRIEAVTDDDGSYVPTAVADEPFRAPGRVTVLAASEILFLDTPAVRPEDDDAGFYLTTRPATAGATWRPAEVHKSDDQGATYASALVVGSEPTTAEVSTPLAVGDPATWDTTQTLRVTLRTGTLQSRTLAAVLAGANMAAVGAHGRWELLQFQTATLVSGSTYDLSVLARGRRGTEHLMGTGIAGDTFVLLSGTGIMRMTLQDAERDVELIYRAVTSGLTFADGTDQTFTSNGEALRPFSPIDVEAEVDLAGDTQITWKRRDRLSQILQGTLLPLSDEPEAYEIEIWSMGSPNALARSLTASGPAVEYTVEDRVTDFGSSTALAEIRVAQVNAEYGAGPQGTGQVTFPASDLLFPESRATFEIGGLFNTADGFAYSLTYTPRSGTATTTTGEISGAALTGLVDFATALATALDAALPAAVTVSSTGGGSPELYQVIASTYDGTLSASVQPLVTQGVVFRLQEPLPVTAGQNQVVEMDLWSSITPAPGVRSPETTTDYRDGGTTSFAWKVGGLTYEVGESLPVQFELNQNGFFDTSSDISSQRTYALQDLVDELTSGAPNLRDYVQGTTWSSAYGAERSVVQMIVKDGYQIYTLADPISTHPSGYYLRLKQLQAGIKSWPSGAKAKDRVYFTPLYTGDPTPAASPFAGQVLYINVDGTQLTHTLTAPEAAAMLPGGTVADLATIYSDFQTQINGLGGYTATVTTTYTYDLRVERDAANTAMVVTAGAQYDLTIGVTIT